jgi:hypothetical protein
MHHPVYFNRNFLSKIDRVATECLSPGARYVGYDWFKSGPAPNKAASLPDPSANHTNSGAPPLRPAAHANHDGIASAASHRTDRDSRRVPATLISEAGVDFLKRKAAAGADPWFLYLPFQNIHGPYTCDKVAMGRRVIQTPLRVCFNRDSPCKVC